MLVLTRKFDESIIIGDGLDAIEVKVVYLGGDKVKLGINAPKTTPIHRKEIYQAILEERAAEERGPA
jgi:carbon storage regulator